MQVITADTVIAYVTHDIHYHQPQADTEPSDVAACCILRSRIIALTMSAPFFDFEDCCGSSFAWAMFFLTEF